MLSKIFITLGVGMFGMGSALLVGEASKLARNIGDGSKVSATTNDLKELLEEHEEVPGEAQTSAEVERRDRAPRERKEYSIEEIEHIEGIVDVAEALEAASQASEESPPVSPPIRPVAPIAQRLAQEERRKRALYMQAYLNSRARQQALRPAALGSR